jgi:hypothetical protein
MRNESGESRKPEKEYAKFIQFNFFKMLNNKKSLLERARIAMIAIVTIMSIGGAFAMKAPTHKSNQTYGTFGLTTTGNHYITTQTAAAPGSYSCNSATTPCTVTSSVAPVLRNSKWEIPKADADVHSIGAFSE